MATILRYVECLTIHSILHSLICFLIDLTFGYYYGYIPGHQTLQRHPIRVQIILPPAELFVHNHVRLSTPIIWVLNGVHLQLKQFIVKSLSQSMLLIRTLKARISLLVGCFSFCVILVINWHFYLYLFTFTVLLSIGIVYCD